MYIEEYVGYKYTTFPIDNHLYIQTKNGVTLTITMCLAVVSLISGEIYRYAKRQLEKIQVYKSVQEDED